MADGVTNYADGDARKVFTETLKGYGFDGEQISKLLPQVVQWQTIYTPGQIVNDLLPTTDVYRQRFSANEDRVRNGLMPLSPSEYIGTENSYRAVMRDAGLPNGFYDSSDDFAKFIANGTSPAEMKTRVSAAQQAVQNADPAYKQALQELYGVDEGTMAAHFLDADRAAPLIEKQAKALEYGTAAVKQGLKATKVGEDFALNPPTTGYSASQGYAQVAAVLPELSKLGQVYGQNYDQSTAEQEVFMGSDAARRKRQKLVQEEVNTFGGQSGLSAGSLQASKSGSF
jgi:hypothetical protein